MSFVWPKTSTGTLPMCLHCGRPITGQIVYAGNGAYHWECTQPPGQQSYQPMPNQFGAIPVPTLTEEDVRRIVREELGRITP